MKKVLQSIRFSTCAPWLLLAFCWLTAFSLSCKLAAASGQGSGPDESGFGQHVARGAGSALSVALAEKADVYFHGGIPRLRKKSFKNRFFQNIASAMVPDGHVHLEGDLMKETLPWYWLAVRSDPHNIDNYLIASYWVATSMDDKKAAHEILMEARRNTRLHYEIEMEDANIYLKEHKLREAESALDAALRIWPSGQDPSGERARIGMVSLLMLKGLLREINGDIARAVACLQQILRITPNDHDIEKRLEELKTGKKPSQKARAILEEITHKANDVAACHRDEENGHDHDHDHDHCKECDHTR